ncbi:ATP-binding protein [Cellulomonas algicola]|uniref:ATP-binding protein n=1 Tax=Cellulomonas algicola TaxID=2071633 RepID=UPI001C3F580A|nr:ATP-binding protein [Cellulomonas algicola]
MPEGQWFERKSGRIAPRDLAVPLVAFANAEGGCIVVGIHSGAVDGVGEGRLNDLREVAQDFTQPVARTRAEVLTTSDGARVLLLRVDPGERVHETTSGDCYLRVGDESRKLGFAQRQELEYDRGGAPFDGTTVDLGVEDLDASQVSAYQLAIGSSSPESMLRARGLLTRQGRLTVAAYLLFGERPQDAFPNAHVRILRYRDVERGTGAGLTLEDAADVRCEGSIPQQITEAANVIEWFLPDRRALGASGRFERIPVIPRDAWLEGLVNAVLHRSYSMAGDHVRVEIFPDRLEIASPGRFPGLVDPSRPLDISRYARNPRIARVCSDLGIAQELGEGIRRIFDEMRARGLTDPVYTQTAGAVQLTLFFSDALPREVRESLPAGALKVLDVLRRVGRPIGTGQVADAAGVTRPTASRHLQRLQDAGLIKWEGQSPKDPRAAWRLT